MTTLSYYLHVCDVEILQDIIGNNWKQNLTIESLLTLHNKINPFIFCEISLFWISEVHPNRHIVKKLFEKLLSMKVSYWFYYDIATKIFNMAYYNAGRNSVFDQLRSQHCCNFKYDRQAWLITGHKLRSFSDTSPVKLTESCSLPGCRTAHSVTVQLEPLFDNKVKLIKDKSLSELEHRHHLYCHWYLAVYDDDQSEEVLFLSVLDFDVLLWKLKSASIAKLYCLLPATTPM